MEQELSPRLVTVNQFRRGNAAVRKGALPFPKRDGGSVKYLCAALATIPKGYGSSKGRKELAQILRACDDTGIAPLPSLVIYGHRRTFPLWLLRDKADPAVPPTAIFGKRNTKHRYSEILYQINSRLAPRLRTNPSEVDVSSLVTIPSETEAWECLDTPPRVFSLSELEEFLQLKQPKRRKRRRKAPGTPKDPRRQDAPLKLNQARIEKLLKLVRHRERLQPKHGREAVRLLALFMRTLGEQRDRILQGVQQLNSAIDPPLEMSVLEECASRVMSLNLAAQGRVKDRRIVEQLEITPKESKLTGWPRASQYRSTEELVPSPPRPTAKEARQTLLRQTVVQLGDAPSVNEWVQMPRDNEHNVSRSSAARDLRLFKQSTLG